MRPAAVRLTNALLVFVLGALVAACTGQMSAQERDEADPVVDVPDSFRVAKTELVSGDDQQAQVALIAADGTRHVLDMVFQEGSWRVRVPMPAGDEAQ